MARKTREAKHELVHFLRAWREAKGLTLEHVADEIGMTHQNLGKIERGAVPLGEAHLTQLARVLGVDIPNLFRDPAEIRRVDLVDVIGRVGANADGAVTFATGDRPGLKAPIPPGGTRHSVALLVEGHSMRGVADDGALIYFENQHTPPTPDMLSQVVVVETDSDEVLVKRLLRGSRAGLYDLESIAGPTRHDVRLRWAAHLTAILPPRQAQLVLEHAVA